MENSEQIDREAEIKQIRKEYPLLFPVAAAVILIGMLTLIGFALFSLDMPSYCINLYTAVLSSAFTIGIVDTIGRYRDKKRYKEDLIYKMSSRINPEAIRAVEEIEREGWLNDGSLQDRIFRRANLEDAQLLDVDLQKSNLRNANLTNSNLMDAKLQNTNLHGAIMQGANLENANLSNSNLYYAELNKANLIHAQLSGARLTFAQITAADMRWANLEGANLSHANLKGVRLEDANLKGVVLSYNLDISFDETTILPNGLSWASYRDMKIFTDPNDPDFWRSDDPESPAYH